MEGDWQPFYQACKELFPSDRFIDDYARRFALGTDASFYRMTPKLVLSIEDESEMQVLLNLASRFKIPLTFRAAGTSLSGQAVTDSVLVLLSPHWNNLEILDEGRRIGLQPGVIGSQANRALAPFNREIGPDPASLNVCKIGGIVANNSSGMCCGTVHNSYQSLSAMRLMLANGALLDTRSAKSVSHFRNSHKPLLEKLQALGERVRNDTPLADIIRHKFAIKNTTGYSLNALVDYEDPIDILIHLMVGSEGTLGFISQVVLDTFPVQRCRAVSLLLFRDISECCSTVSALKHCCVDAVELIDSRSLAAVRDKPGLPLSGNELLALGEDAAALLVETRAESAAHLEENIATILATIKTFEMAIAPVFSSDAKVIEELWSIRKGLFPSVGAMRNSGTTVIIEDVAFPITCLADGVRDLHKLFYDFGYDDALIFGHALDGNIHFVFSQDFDDHSERERYRAFMSAVCHMVAVDYKGSLKAEHGTGRNMAPFVELEWGAEAYSLMWQIKNIFDPYQILNPGVILNKDPDIHLKNLKPMPVANPLIDKCIECGFCEPVCPSRQLSLTPRQRITLYREIQSQQSIGADSGFINKLVDDFSYLAVDTCAATGLCEEQCPVGINTGELVKEYRENNNQKWKSSANLIARHFDGVTHMVRGGLHVADISHRLLSTDGMQTLTQGLRHISGNNMPLWTPAMPRAGRPHRLKEYRPSIRGDEVIYWPSCVARNFSPPKGSDQMALPDIVLKLLDRAGFRVRLVSESNLCCGQPFETKGHRDIAEDKRRELEARLMGLSNEGEIPILSDTSPCMLRLQQSMTSLSLFDPIQFALEHLAGRLRLTPVAEKVALHITCSTRKMGLATKAEELAKRCAQEVIIPNDIECCGFAGDKGFFTPELNASALSSLKAKVGGCSRGYSTSLTCEIGLTHHGKIPYSSILYLVDQACV